ncbi:MAG TPA: hypothetical protein VF516_44725, partial [Kofleriaceae bacterium]
CASCYWGVALVLGPNYNVPMLANRFPAAWQALQRAQQLAPSATPVEQALIAALARRYPGARPRAPDAMAPFNQAYADAMTEVAGQFPDDLDVQTLRAEALMDLAPWKLWTADGKPAQHTVEILMTLESVLARDPRHPGANHYYLHAVEASPQPGRALASADRLPALMPGAGHIVHMPAHIYQRVGRYADASAANRRAAEIDQRYLPGAPAWGYYGMYLSHNCGFLSYSAAMEGRSAESLAAARCAARTFPAVMLAMMPGMDFFVAEPLLAMVRFGKFDGILATPRPDPGYPTLTALWLHAHGLARAATGDLAAADADLAELRRMAAQTAPGAVTLTNEVRDILDVGTRTLEAVLAHKRGDPRELALWDAAVAAEDRLSYSEPSDWFYPVRHYQGEALLELGRWSDAEAVYRADLANHPRNGWALWGLVRALRGQHRDREAAAVDQEFHRAWANADFALTATAFW